jgi:hypothetical protein
MDERDAVLARIQRREQQLRHAMDRGLTTLQAAAEAWRAELDSHKQRDRVVNTLQGLERTQAILWELAFLQQQLGGAG